MRHRKQTTTHKDKKPAAGSVQGPSTGQGPLPPGHHLGSSTSEALGKQNTKGRGVGKPSLLCRDPLLLLLSAQVPLAVGVSGARKHCQKRKTRLGALLLAFFLTLQARKAATSGYLRKQLPFQIHHRCLLTNLSPVCVNMVFCAIRRSQGTRSEQDQSASCWRSQKESRAVQVWGTRGWQ